MCCLPFVVGLASYVYLFGALFLNIIFIAYAVNLYKATGVLEHRVAIKTFNFSLLFLLLLFILLIIDQGVRL